jgi:hypothetical protein
MGNTAILEHGAKIAAAAAILAIGLAGARSVAAGPEATPSPAAGAYLPSISDLMIATIQPRHERLGRPRRMETGNLQLTKLETSRGHSIGSGGPIPPNTTSPSRR